MADTTIQPVSAYDTLLNAFKAYNLTTLVPVVQKYMQQGISDSGALLAAVRADPTYAARFPAMAAILDKGHGTFNEADYINYEINAAQAETTYGLPKGFLTDSHRIQGMLENDVSASDVTNRAALNAAAATTAPQETKDALQRLYGLDQSALTAYYFDPENSVPYLQKQQAAATLAGQAAKQQVTIDRTMAETLAAQNVTQAQAAAGFGQVATQAGLQTGVGETANQSDLVNAAFGDAAAQQKVARVQGARAAQFQGGGGAAATGAGVTGLANG
jgi:hypothetical protein